MNSMNDVKGLSLIVTIVDRKIGKKVKKVFKKFGCNFHLTFVGKGTAPKEIFDYLGIGIIEKDVVLSVVDYELKDQLLDSLKNKLHFDKPGKGVACSIPINGIDSAAALERVLKKEN